MVQVCGLQCRDWIPPREKPTTITKTILFMLPIWEERIIPPATSLSLIHISIDADIRGTAVRCLCDIAVHCAQYHHRTYSRQNAGKHVLVLQLPFHAEGDIYNGAGIPGGGCSASGAVVQRDLPQEHNREVKSRSVMLRLISFFGRVDYILGIFYGSCLTYAGR